MRNCVEILLLMSLASPLLSPRATVAQKAEKPSSIRTVVDLSPEDLTRTYRELKNVQFAPNQDDLSLLLENVGNRVQELFRDFPNTSSHERIRMARLNSSGGAVSVSTKDFQYLFVAQSARQQSEQAGSNTAATLPPETAQVKIEEYRTDSKGSEIDVLKLEDSFVVTSGYVTLPLNFHPYYRDGSVFRYVGMEATGTKDHVIAFAQIPGKSRLGGNLQSSAGLVAFFIQGFAWVDPITYRILRIRTDLLTPLSEAGLLEQTTRIELAEVRFKETGRTLWLPHEVVVTSRSMGYSFRNRHEYSDYKLFTVDVNEVNKQIVVPSKPPH